MVTLSWELPSTEPGSAIIEYRVYRGTVSGSEYYLNTAGNTLSYIDSAVSNGQIYYYQVTAVNASGESDRSNEIFVTPSGPSTVPSPPQNLVAQAGDGQISLTWDAPLESEATWITGYNIYRGTTPGGESPLTTVGKVLAFSDAGLTNGITYYYTVRASNSIGSSLDSNEASATPSPPVVIPSAPQNLVAVAGDQQVSLSWDALPIDSAVDRYYVYQDGVEVGQPTTTSIVITGLTNGVQYNFTVAAHNSAGIGPETEKVASTPRAGASVPGVPTSVQATPGDGEVSLAWSAPTSDGGAAIDYYLVFQDDGQVANVTGTSALITGLTNGQEYNYTVAAHNSIGLGPQSAVLSVTPSTTITAPEAPTGLEATPGDGAAYLSWTAPGNNGGEAIDYYIVYRDGVDVLHSEETSATIGNLTNGQMYSFTVAAHNSAGEGPRSPGATVTPSSDNTAPGAPTNLKIAPGDGQVTLTWAAPTDQGSSPIDYYVVYMNGVDVAHPTGTSITISGLTNGQEYRFMVAAHNSVGKGAMTISYKATPAEPGFFSNSNNILMLAVVAAVIVVAALTVMMLMRRRAPPSQDRPPEPPEQPEIREEVSAPAPPVPPSSGMAIFEKPVATKAPPAEVPCPRCGKLNTGSYCELCGQDLDQPA